MRAYALKHVAMMVRTLLGVLSLCERINAAHAVPGRNNR
jgi:hypothetical protein